MGGGSGGSDGYDAEPRSEARSPAEHRLDLLGGLDPLVREILDVLRDQYRRGIVDAGVDHDIGPVYFATGTAARIPPLVHYPGGVRGHPEGVVQHVYVGLLGDRVQVILTAVVEHLPLELHVGDDRGAHLAVVFGLGPMDEILVAQYVGVQHQLRVAGHLRHSKPSS